MEVFHSFDWITFSPRSVFDPRLFTVYYYCISTGVQANVRTGVLSVLPVVFPFIFCISTKETNTSDVSFLLQEVADIAADTSAASDGKDVKK